MILLSEILKNDGQIADHNYRSKQGIPMLRRNKKNSLSILIILTLLTAGLTPSTMYSQNSGNKSSGVPTWAKATFCFWRSLWSCPGKSFYL